MVQEKSDWVLTKLDTIPPKIFFESGATIPLLGEYYNIFHDPNQKEVVIKSRYEIRLGGRQEHLSRLYETRFLIIMTHRISHDAVRPHLQAPR